MFSSTVKIRAAATLAATLSLAAAIPAISTAKPILPATKTVSAPKSISPCDALLNQFGADVGGFVSAQLDGNQSAMDGFAAAVGDDRAKAKSLGCAWAA